jgi:hypothetical protein
MTKLKVIWLFVVVGSHLLSDPTCQPLLSPSSSPTYGGESEFAPALKVLNSGLWQIAAFFSEAKKL